MQLISSKNCYNFSAFTLIQITVSEYLDILYLLFSVNFSLDTMVLFIFCIWIHNLSFFGFCCYLAKIIINCVSNSCHNPQKCVILKKKLKSMFLSHNLYFGVRLVCFYFIVNIVRYPRSTGMATRAWPSSVLGFRFGNKIVGNCFHLTCWSKLTWQKGLWVHLEVLKVQIYTERDGNQMHVEEFCLEHWLIIHLFVIHLIDYKMLTNVCKFFSHWNYTIWYNKPC